jgi:hypothetical protein
MYLRSFLWFFILAALEGVGHCAVIIAFGTLAGTRRSRSQKSDHPRAISGSMGGEGLYHVVSVEHACAQLFWPIPIDHVHKRPRSIPVGLCHAGLTQLGLCKVGHDFGSLARSAAAQIAGVGVANLERPRK